MKYDFYMITIMMIDSLIDYNQIINMYNSINIIDINDKLKFQKYLQNKNVKLPENNIKTIF